MSDLIVLVPDHCLTFTSDLDITILRPWRRLNVAFLFSLKHLALNDTDEVKYRNARLSH